VSAAVHHTVELALPDGWYEVDPPAGVELVVVAPLDPDLAGLRVRSNVVVTQRRRDLELTVADYVDGVLDSLRDELDGFEVHHVGADEIGGRPVQRVIGRHAVAAQCIEIVQQHTWFDDRVVIATATVDPSISDADAAVIGACLDSLAITIRV
jgi:hypothetical protein